MGKEYWEDKHYSFFSNRECEYFHAIKGQIRKISTVYSATARCMLFGDKCGGIFRYTENGIKDCTNCQLPHKRKNYGYVTGKYQELAEMMRKIKDSE